MAETAGSNTLEQNFTQIEALLETLSSDEISLEEAFAAYSAGMRLLKNCNDQIDQVEKKVLKLAEDGTLTALDE